MLPKILLPKLTRQYLLRYITEEDIFEKYLGISYSENISFCNPLRVDYDPTCRFKRGIDGRPRMKDFAGYFSGDCYDLVAYYLNGKGGIRVRYNNKQPIYKTEYCNVKNKVHFVLILHDIAKRFKLHEYSKCKTEEELKYLKADKTIVKVEAITTIIEYESRYWEQNDIIKWNPITLGLLNYFEVNPVSKAYLNGSQIYYYKNTDRCYCYEFGKGKRELYFIDRNERKFLLNKNMLVGLDKVQPARIGVITKSYKDMISLRLLKINNETIQSLAVTAESYTITEDEAWEVKKLFNVTLFLADFDYAGIKASIIHYLKYSFIPIYFVRVNVLTISQIKSLYKEFGYENIKKFIGKNSETSKLFTKFVFDRPEKDSFDFIKIKGKEEGQRLVDTIYETLKPMLDKYDEYYKQICNGISL